MEGAMKKTIEALWVVFGIGGFLGLFSAPIAYNFGKEAMTLSLYIGLSSVAVLALLAVLSLWFIGAKERPGILGSVFLGIGLAGLLSLVLGAQDVGTLAVSVSACGLLVTGLVSQIGKSKQVAHH